MNWIDLKKAQPLHDSYILPYCTDMEPEEWMEEGLWPIMKWDAIAHEAWDPVDERLFKITHWLPFPGLLKE